MTRFPNTGKEIEVTGGGTLTVLTGGPLAWDNLSSLVSLHLEAALMCLETTNRLLGSAQIPSGGRIVTLANRYFLTGAAIAPNDLFRIQTVVIKIWTGLKADNVRIKTGNQINGAGRGGSNSMGAAAYKYQDEDEPPVKPTKPYHNRVTALDTGDTKVYKTIQLHTDSFKHPGFGTANLLHEASHKFAGTIDYGYFDWGGVNPRNPGGFTDKNKALMNADSYGYFILNCSKARFDWSNPLPNPV